LKKILGENLFEIISKKKKIREGIGKRRGRRYKTNASLLLVISSKEKIDARIFERKNAKNLSVTDLANGDFL
jgi:hypothetical protein